MKRGFFLGLLLAGAALFSGCGMLRGAAKLLGSEESRERFAERWSAFSEELHTEAERAFQSAELALPGAEEDFMTGGASLAAEGVRQIEVVWVSGGVEVSLHDGEEIVFSEESAGELSERDMLRYRVRDGKLTIACCAGRRASINLPEKRLTLRLPAALAPEELEITLVSAELAMQDVQAEKIALTTVSGNLALRGLTAQKLAIETVSGEAVLAQCSVNRSISIDSVSGNASIQLPQEAAGFSVDFDSVSGVLQCARETARENGRQVYGDGSLIIDMDSVSGNLKIG